MNKVCKNSILQTGKFKILCESINQNRLSKKNKNCKYSCISQKIHLYQQIS